MKPPQWNPWQYVRNLLKSSWFWNDRQISFTQETNLRKHRTSKWEETDLFQWAIISDFAAIQRTTEKKATAFSLFHKTPHFLTSSLGFAQVLTKVSSLT